jgi:type II secretory pathway pseudopilin PulG|tara:strand:- start:359 stop:847 length:489 start_codon:yes stop_codon:yes gene_type:complete
MKNYLKKTSKGFTIAEFVVTIALMGTMMSVVLPSFDSITLNMQSSQNKTNMDMIRQVFFGYFYDTHMKGVAHLPPSPDNDEGLMDEEWSNLEMRSSLSPATPNDLFSGGKVPTNANGYPFSYEMWTDTTYLGSDGMKVDYFVRISDVDEDSPSFEISVTSAI